MDRPTVLVIDYEPRNLAATVEPLTAAGYHVEVARDGIAGLDAFRRLHPPVVFMEAMLPKKHAFEVCQEIRRAQGSKTKVFILGAPTIAQSQQVKAVRQYGADRFLPRPVDAETLVSLCSPVLPGPKAPQIPEIDLLEPIAVQRAATPAPDLLQALGPRDLNSMSEEDIMAQLDQLLPSVPASTPVAKAIPQAARTPTPIPVAPRKTSSAPVPRPSVASAPMPAPRPSPRPAPAPSPVRAVMTPPVLVPSPPPDLRPPSAEAAPTPVPRRSKLPMVLTACVLVAAGIGSWMLLRPGSAPVAKPATETFADLAPTAEPPAPAPVGVPGVPTETPQGTETAPAETARAPLHVAPAPPVVPTMASPAKPAPSVQTKTEPIATEKVRPPPAPKVVTETAGAQPPAPKPTPTPETDAADTTAEAAPETSGAEAPLPLAPPRLEPLPVGSDAARPRISPEVFVRRVTWGSLVELRDADKPPVAVSRPAPNYPMAARQMRREGEVELRLLIDAQGQVAAVEVLTGGRSDYAQAAERAVRKWKYRAAMKDGVPVQVKIVEKVTFKL